MPTGPDLFHKGESDCSSDGLSRRRGAGPNQEKGKGAGRNRGEVRSPLVPDCLHCLKSIHANGASSTNTESATHNQRCTIAHDRSALFSIVIVPRLLS